MNLSLTFRLDHRDNLGTGLHQFCLGHHTYDVRKLPKDHVDQHQIIGGGCGAPTLANTAYLTSPDRVSLY